MKLVELKAQAYDIIADIGSLQKALRQTNNQRTETVQREQNKLKKEDIPCPETNVIKKQE